jgi:predicted RNA binding protein YcfA (HicA-like mRNA interferase family)
MVHASHAGLASPYRHAVKSGRVTIAGKPSDDMAPGTLNSVLKQAGLKERT